MSSIFPLGVLCCRACGAVAAEMDWLVDFPVNHGNDFRTEPYVTDEVPCLVCHVCGGRNTAAVLGLWPDERMKEVQSEERL